VGAAAGAAVTESAFFQDLMLFSRAAQVALQDEVVERFPEAGPGPARMAILRLLGRQERQSVNDLALFLAQTKAAASQNVDGLVRSGLVRREDEPADRRKVWVVLTPRGRRLLQKLEAQQVSVLKRALRGLPRETHGQFSRNLRLLAFALLEETHLKSGHCLQCCAFNSAGCAKGPGGLRCAYLVASAPSRRRGRGRSKAPAGRR
jgi:DNA-binding MarR family transcriptional regulator